MTSKVNLTEPLSHQLSLLQGDVRRGDFHREQVGDEIVQVTVNKAKLEALSTFVPKVDAAARAEIEQTLRKIQRKIQFTEKVLEFLTSGPNRVDPRLQAIYEKLAKLNQFDDKLTPDQREKIHNKLQKYRGSMTFLASSDEPNKATQDMLPAVFSDIKLRLLNIAPQVNIVDRIPNPDQYYKGLQDIEACKAMSSIAIAKCYLDNVTMLREDYVSYSAVNHGHQLTGQFLLSLTRGSLPKRISLQDLITLESSYSDLRILDIPEAMRSNAPQTNLKDPEGALEHCVFLSELAKTARLKSIGAVITMGSDSYALMFHSDQRISLFVPTGDKERNGQPYQVFFGNTPQAAAFLANLLKEKNVHEEKSLIIPVCRQSELREAMESERNEQLSSSSSSSSLFSDDESANPVQAPLSLEKMVPFAAMLQKAIDALSPKTDEGFFESLSHFQEIGDCKWLFAMTDQDHDQKVLDRIYLHLYHIQDKETPEKVNRSDFNYGMNAFQTEGLATPEEKLRAVQRVQAEVLLELVARALNRSDAPALQLFIGALEKLNLDPRDLPKGQTNISHALFGKLYDLYIEARKTNPDLEDPNSKKFNGDFGRAAFCDLKLGIDELRRAALKDELKALKDTWRI